MTQPEWLSTLVLVTCALLDAMTVVIAIALAYCLLRRERGE